MNGGSENKNKDRKKRYDNLAVPVGLFISSVAISGFASGIGRSMSFSGGNAGGSSNTTYGGTISDELYDEMLERAR